MTGIQLSIMQLLGNYSSRMLIKFQLVLRLSTFRNQPEVMETLINKNAVVDCTNRGRCTPLHVAVNKRFPSCVRMLLKYNCDVNIQVIAIYSLKL